MKANLLIVGALKCGTMASVEHLRTQSRHLLLSDQGATFFYRSHDPNAQQLAALVGSIHAEDVERLEYEFTP